MIHSFLCGDICTCSFHYVFSTTFFPRNIYSFSTTVYRDFLSVNNKSFIIEVQTFRESSEGGVIPEHIHKIFKVSISDIDSCNFYLRHIHSCSYDYSGYSAETTDTYFDRHFFLLLNSLNDNIFNIFFFLTKTEYSFLPCILPRFVLRFLYPFHSVSPQYPDR